MSLDAKLAILKTKITLTRCKLNQAWAVNQKTDAAVLAIGMELDRLCNEYERLMKAADVNRITDSSQSHPRDLPENKGSN